MAANRYIAGSAITMCRKRGGFGAAHGGFAKMLNKTKQPTRKTGIDILGNAPWGMHFCLFYKTKEDWIETAKKQARVTDLANFSPAKALWWKS